MNEHRKKLLEEEKKRFEKDIDRISINMGFHDPASSEYLNLDRKHKFLCRELDKIESELSSDKESSLTNHQRGNLFDKKLPKIDFGKPKRTIEQILEKFGRNGVSAFFLIENTTSTRGDLLVHEIRDSLTKENDDLKHCQINLLSNPIIDEQSLLCAIADFFPKSDSDTQPSDNSQQYARHIIDKIIGRLQVGSIVFFELNYWDALQENQGDLLSWFIKYFWIPLTEKHLQISKNYSNIRIILFMTTGSSLSNQCLSLPYFCNQSQFSNQKVLKLSLQKKWKQEEISLWIEDVYKYSRQDSLRESNLIFNLSQGDPVKTCLVLQQKFNSIS
jgi:hypothetical protein